MNGKRPAEPGPGQTGKKRKKEVTAEFSDAVTEEILKKQVAEAWSHRTPLRHGKAGAAQGESPRGVRGPRIPGALLQPTRKGAAPEARGPHRPSRHLSFQVQSGSRNLRRGRNVGRRVWGRQRAWEWRVEFWNQGVADGICSTDCATLSMGLTW